MFQAWVAQWGGTRDRVTSVHKETFTRVHLARIALSFIFIPPTARWVPLVCSTGAVQHRDPLRVCVRLQAAAKAKAAAAAQAARAKAAAKKLAQA